MGDSISENPNRRQTDVTLAKFLTNYVSKLTTRGARYFLCVWRLTLPSSACDDGVKFITSVCLCLNQVYNYYRKSNSNNIYDIDSSKIPTTPIWHQQVPPEPNTHSLAFSTKIDPEWPRKVPQSGNNMVHIRAHDTFDLRRYHLPPCIQWVQTRARF